MVMPDAQDKLKEEIAAGNSMAAFAMAQAFADAAGDDGLWVWIAPGLRHAPLSVAWAQMPNVHTVSVLDERVAGFAALGAAMQQGVPAVVLTTSGSAGAHTLPAVMEARAQGVPMLVITADRPPDLHGFAAPQSVDQRSMLAPYVLWAQDPGLATTASADHWQALAVAAWHHAKTHRGPVHLNCSFAEPLWQIARKFAQKNQFPPKVVEAVHRQAQSALWPQDMVDGLKQLQRPWVLVGAHALPAWAGPDEVGALCEALVALQAPVVLEPTSGLWGQIPSRLQDALGALCIGGAAAVWSMFWGSDEAAGAQPWAPDGVVMLGKPPCERGIWAVLRDRNIPAWILKPCSTEPGWSDPWHQGQWIVQGDGAASLAQIRSVWSADGQCECESKRMRQAWLMFWQKHVHASVVGSAAWRGHGQSPDGWALQALQQVWTQPAAKSDATNPNQVHGWLQVASSMAVRTLERWSLPLGWQGCGISCNRGLNGIDGTLSTALGAWHVQPLRPMAVLCGDLAFLHDVGALATAMTLQANLTVVVLDNSGGGIFAQLPIVDTLQEDVLAKAFVAPQNVDVAAVAEGFGARVARPQNAVELVDILQQAYATPGLDVVHLRSQACDPKLWLKRLQDEIKPLLQQILAQK